MCYNIYADKGRTSLQISILFLIIYTADMVNKVISVEDRVIIGISSVCML
jgi:hypothetical protein